MNNIQYLKIMIILRVLATLIWECWLRSFESAGYAHLRVLATLIVCKAAPAPQHLPGRTSASAHKRWYQARAHKRLDFGFAHKRLDFFHSGPGAQALGFLLDFWRTNAWIFVLPVLHCISSARGLACRILLLSFPQVCEIILHIRNNFPCS